ncbi:MAG: hypothetical protein KGJ02_04755 [Verrucomicrobiota bacterium]|nr:hypothetical protein [Verrucomicrobiota bacterium]
MRWLWLLMACHLFGEMEQKIFPLTAEMIDVVIPYHRKDAGTLEWCIEGIRKYAMNVRRIVVVSEARPTENAEWFDEANFPFTKEDLILEIGVDVDELPESRLNSVYQKLLKLYAPFVVPQISTNVLVVDSDVVFLNLVDFITSDGFPCFNFGSKNKQEHFDHMGKLVRGLGRAHSNYSGITHQMLFQRPILEDLFALIQEQHGVEPWRAICRIDKAYFSEYELYFNFALQRTPQARMRRLKWCDLSGLVALPRYKKQYYAYVALHRSMRSGG